MTSLRSTSSSSLHQSGQIHSFSEATTTSTTLGSHSLSDLENSTPATPKKTGQIRTSDPTRSISVTTTISTTLGSHSLSDSGNSTPTPKKTVQMRTSDATRSISQEKQLNFEEALSYYRSLFKNVYPFEGIEARITIIEDHGHIKAVWEEFKAMTMSCTFAIDQNHPVKAKEAIAYIVARILATQTIEAECKPIEALFNNRGFLYMTKSLHANINKAMGNAKDAPPVLLTTKQELKRVRRELLDLKTGLPTMKFKDEDDKEAMAEADTKATQEQPSNLQRKNGEVKLRIQKFLEKLNDKSRAVLSSSEVTLMIQKSSKLNDIYRKALRPSVDVQVIQRALATIMTFMNKHHPVFAKLNSRSQPNWSVLGQQERTFTMADESLVLDTPIDVSQAPTFEIKDLPDLIHTATVTPDPLLRERHINEISQLICYGFFRALQSVEQEVMLEKGIYWLMHTWCTAAFKVPLKGTIKDFVAQTLEVSAEIHPLLKMNISNAWHAIGISDQEGAQSQNAQAIEPQQFLWSELSLLAQFRLGFLSSIGYQEDKPCRSLDISPEIPDGIQSTKDQRNHILHFQQKMRSIIKKNLEFSIDQLKSAKQAKVETKATKEMKSIESAKVEEPNGRKKFARVIKNALSTRRRIKAEAEKKAAIELNQAAAKEITLTRREIAQLIEHAFGIVHYRSDITSTKIHESSYNKVESSTLKVFPFYTIGKSRFTWLSPGKIQDLEYTADELDNECTTTHDLEGMYTRMVDIIMRKFSTTIRTTEFEKTALHFHD